MKSSPSASSQISAHSSSTSSFPVAPTLELLLAGLLWGYGFVATVFVLEFLDAPAVIFYRFVGAFLLGAVILLALRIPASVWWSEAKRSFWLGSVLGLTLVLQAWGLVSTTPTKSAFLTTLYVLLVPLFAVWLGWEKFRKSHWFFVVLALVGIVLMVEAKWSTWTFGDTLTLANAFTAAFHILLAGHLLPQCRHPFALSVLQSLWVAVFCTIFFFFDLRWNLFSLDARAVASLVFLVIGTSLVAFWLQLRAQRSISASSASLLYLLESPFSMLFSVWLLGERLSGLQLLGCALILGSCAAVVLRSPRPIAH